MLGKIITVLARLGGREPLTEHALLDPSGSITVFGDRLDYVVTYRDPREALPHATVPIRWLKNMGGQAGKRGSAIFGMAEGRVTAQIKTTTYGVRPARDVTDFAPVSGSSVPWTMLSVADWTKGGAVASAEPFASNDEARASLWGVHLGADVRASDGTKVALREPVASMAAIDATLSLPAVRAMLKLVAATAPVDLACQVAGERVWFHARSADGTSWTLTAKLTKGFPDMTQVTAEANAGSLIEVSAHDLRTLWAPFKSRFTLAIYKDGGMLVWDADDAERGVGMTLTAPPTEAPFAVFGERTVPTLAKNLPHAGKVGVRSAGPGIACMVAGELVAQVIYKMPDHVERSVRSAFAA